MTELKHLSKQLSIGPEFQSVIKSLQQYVHNLVMKKLPDGITHPTDNLIYEVTEACHTIIGDVGLETGLMYVSGKDLEQRNKEAMEIHEKMRKGKKKNAPLYSPIDYDEISRQKDQGKIRKHFRTENFVNGNIRGVYFQNHEGKVIACVYHNDEKNKEYILINHTLSEYPVSAHIFTNEVLKVFHKLQSKYRDSGKK